MRAWHFSETAYPYLPPADTYPSIRVSLPNRIYDPEKGAALYDRYIDEWLVAEEEGVDIMLNEHHQTATCVDPAAPLMLAALARQSKTARIAARRLSRLVGVRGFEPPAPSSRSVGPDCSFFPYFNNLELRAVVFVSAA